MAENKEPAKEETTPADATTKAAKAHSAATAEPQTDTVKVKFPDGTDADGKQLYRVQEVGRELAESELAKSETAPKELKEGEVLKLRNPAWKGAKIVK